MSQTKLIMPNKNSRLNTAKKNKKDEFYTQLKDIEAEVSHYTKHFEGKTVYCNCDDPTKSNFVKYFKEHLDELKLRRLIATCWKGRDGLGTAWKFDTDNGESLTTLTGDGDFRSDECIELLKQTDIVVTNPPFSLFRQYFKQLVQYEKQFLIIGNQTSITHKVVFPLIKENKVWFGVEIHGGSTHFYSPYEDTATAGEHKEGMVLVSGVVWFTNLDHEKRHNPLELKEHYSPTVNPKYDNYDAIEVGETVCIPCDYYETMGVPLSFLNKYCPEQFEIIGIAKRGAGDPALKTRVYTKSDYPNYSDLNASPTLLDENGTPHNVFPRILIRRRPDNSTEHPHNAT